MLFRSGALNEQFRRWVEEEYNARVHSTLQMKPVDQISDDAERERMLTQQCPHQHIQQQPEPPAEGHSDPVWQCHTPVDKRHGDPRRPPMDGPFRKRQSGQHERDEERRGDDGPTPMGNEAHDRVCVLVCVLPALGRVAGVSPGHTSNTSRLRSSRA